MPTPTTAPANGNSWRQKLSRLDVLISPYLYLSLIHI